MNILLAALIFFVYAAIDGLYVIYTLEMTRLRPLRAAISAVGIYALNAFGVIVYTGNPVYVIFVVLGAFCGTFLVVWLEKRKKKNEA